MPPTPDLNELRAFCVAADLGTLGRAAVRLHVSQPSLSKRLAALEAKVGAQLLERSPRGVDADARRAAACTGTRGRCSRPPTRSAR